MALADIGNPSKLAEAIIGQLGTDGPLATPIDEIALALDITSIKDLDAEGFEGALLTDDAKSEGVILVKRNSIPERRRFTIGHELGHFLCPFHVPSEGGFRCSGKDMIASEAAVDCRTKWEVEANAFAAELLMPRSTFLRVLRARKVLELERLVKIADDFQVSKIACGRRIADVGDEPCAVLVSHRRTLKTLYRSREFPFIPLRIGMQLPTKSRSATFEGAPGAISETEESESALWTDGRRQGLAIFEQVLVQLTDYRLTLLTCEQADDEDVEAASAWSPRFK